MASDSDEQQRHASASILCEDPFSSSTPHAEELEYNIDFLINHQDIRQCHFPGDQNRAEDRYEEEAHNPKQRGRSTVNMYFNRSSLSPDQVVEIHVGLPRWNCFFLLTIFRS